MRNNVIFKYLEFSEFSHYLFNLTISITNINLQKFPNLCPYIYLQPTNNNCLHLKIKSDFPTITYMYINISNFTPCRFWR